MEPKADDVVGGVYRLDRQIGQGGMGAVWRAVHTETYKAFAVKLTTARGPRAEASVKRFFREAKIAAAIRHKNVVAIHDFGTTDDGVPYMVMDLLEGESLQHLLEEGPPMTIREFLELMLGALGGVAAAHDAGIVHRDLKPANIFISRDGFPKVLDFGLSRLLVADDEDSKLTGAGAFVGTIGYMSTEAARGITDLDARSDVYGLGVVLFEAIAGRLPFLGEHPGDVLFAIMSSVAQRLDVLRGDVPESLADVVARCLHRDAGDRYADARELRDALRQVVEDVDPRARVRLTSRRFESDAATIDPEILASKMSREPTVPFDEPVALTEPYSPSPDRRARWIALGAVLALALGVAFFWVGRPPVSGSPQRSTPAEVDTPEVQEEEHVPPENPTPPSEAATEEVDDPDPVPEPELMVEPEPTVMRRSVMRARMTKAGMNTEMGFVRDPGF